ncbi:hypothetical protein CN918_29305 [Priestia megaterium]|nr:hypothetical protein CN918_29305 [Priestia megaterium]
MFQVNSEFYEKEVTLELEEAETMIAIYQTVAKKRGFKSEAASPEELCNANTYDHVAYHVENFGENHPDFNEVQHLFEG